MWTLLPLTALIALTYCIAGPTSWRGAFLRALTVFGAATVLITEMLSSMGAVRAGPVAFSWAVIAVTASAVGWKRKARLPQLQWPGWINAAMIAASAGIIGVVLVTAIASAPNSTDAMTYHLPRIIYWIQAGNVAFFPTPYLNQLMLQPMAEYLMLHTYLLSGGDALVNLVQWIGCAGSIVGVSLISRSLGAGVRGQAISALFCATLPNGILQASGAKNDYVLALWLVVMAWLGFEWAARRRLDDLLLMALALGLALFTKGTAYLFAPPMLAVVLWPARRRVLPAIGVLAAGVLLMNGPLYWRNFDLSGSPLGFDSAHGNGFFRWRNEHLGWRASASNLLRNSSEQLGSRSEIWNQRVYDAVIRAHWALGLDANDQDTTWRWSQYEKPRNANHETNANNRWHLLLIALAAGWLVWKRHPAAALPLASAVAFTLFCSYLKWQPFQARLLLPLFVLTAPATGVALEMLRYGVLQLAICLFLLSGARLPLLQNWVRPLTGPNSVFRTSRQDQYFADLTFWGNKQSYLDAVEAVKRSVCKTIGIDGTQNEIEYPLQALLLRSDPQYRFLHTSVQNASLKYARGDGQPCVVVCLDCAGNQDKLRMYGADPVLTSGRFLVFRTVVNRDERIHLNNR
jgi:4-amino-4-deoxy-L-arabinose transferase-like glycosyltransferase